MKMRVLIADDEPLARERLRFLLANEEDLEIAKECRNGKEVIEALKQDRYQVLFLDIEMPGRGGFEVIEQIGPENMPITVFVTAHLQYAVQAFEVHALDYLTKPIEPQRLEATLKRVKQRAASDAALQTQGLLTQDQFKSILAVFEGSSAPKPEYPKRLLVPNGGPNGTRNSFVRVSEIDWIEAADYYVCLHIGNRSLMLRESIKRLAVSLDPERFVRIHRSVIVNVDQIREVFREGRKEAVVVLANGQRLKMSRAGWESLLAASHTLPSRISRPPV